jgi:hypothetical protein
VVQDFVSGRGCCVNNITTRTLNYNLSSRGSEGQHPSGLLLYVLSIVIVTLD